QLHELENFMKSPAIHTFSKTAVSQAIVQMSFEGSERRKEVIQCYSSILKFYLKADLKDNVIDSNLIGHIIVDIMNIQGKELLTEITELFDLEYVAEEVCGDLEAVEYNMAISHEASQENEIFSIKDLYQNITESWINKGSTFNFNDETENEPPVNMFYNDDKPYISENKVGRNDPCPCGSGKKYKKCCL
ncbi:MAG TPA: SEC-C metal-binding domain-containing protein, partial [Brumimicrobium sp.]|nr:SEC-C metal-binding domain-containing protein [Brumimicrobium sp.]